jgi:hypothetical protein
MARPRTPDIHKSRTVPLRTGKPNYRMLLTISAITDETIQQLARIALDEYLDRRRQEINTRVSFTIPPVHEMGSWKDHAFEEWLGAMTRRDVPPKPEFTPPPLMRLRGLRVRSLQPVYDETLNLFFDHPHNLWTEAALTEELDEPPHVVRHVVRHLIDNRIVRRDHDFLRLDG